jgi:hypothetical protein
VIDENTLASHPVTASFIFFFMPLPKDRRWSEKISNWQKLM